MPCENRQLTHKHDTSLSTCILFVCATPITIVGGITRCLVRPDNTALTGASVYHADRLTARVVKRTDLCRQTMVMTWCDEEYDETWLECNYLQHFVRQKINFDGRTIRLNTRIFEHKIFTCNFSIHHSAANDTGQSESTTRNRPNRLANWPICHEIIELFFAFHAWPSPVYALQIVRSKSRWTTNVSKIVNKSTN